MKQTKVLLRSAVLFLFFSCATLPANPSSETLPETAAEAIDEVLTLTFAGDIMAHDSNTRMDDYSEIYAAITDITLADDLTFANFETPVHSGRPYESYPTFNVKAAYPDAAIAAGFDVFSLANNHTNDQGLEGIQETYKYFSGKPKGVYSAGIKGEARKPALTYQLMDVRGKKILFAAITELLNAPRFTDYIDYIPPTKSSRDQFLLMAQELRQNNPCDLFVLSIHTAEPEYVHTIAPSQRNYYYSLLASGVDIVWANHPHVARGWEFVGEAGTERLSKLIIYSNGNTISGQRRNPQWYAPATPRDDTGDGYLLCVRVTKEGIEAQPVYITTHIDDARHFLIKKLDDAFVQKLRDDKKTTQADYYAARKKITEQISGTSLWR
jgi:poly-gamma-glutamate synthesis protein (capsule biosynthesis protein)